MNENANDPIVDAAVAAAVLPEILTVSKLSEALGLSKGRVRDLIRLGRIPACRVGRRYITRLDDLLAALEPGAPRRSSASAAAWCSVCRDRPAVEGRSTCARCGDGREAE